MEALGRVAGVRRSMNVASAPCFLAQAIGSSDTADLLINILILAIVLIVAFWIVGRMAAPEPIGTILRLIIGIIGLIWLLNLIGFVGGHRFIIYHYHHP